MSAISLKQWRIFLCGAYLLLGVFGCFFGVVVVVVMVVLLLLLLLLNGVGQC